MADTDLLFLRDAYLQEATAQVLDIRENAVVLDRTIFYATGGGQPHDTGTLGGQVVVDVRKEGGAVLHVLAEGAVSAYSWHPSRTNSRLATPTQPHAHSHSNACVVWRYLERVACAGNGRQHGAIVCANGF